MVNVPQLVAMHEVMERLGRGEDVAAMVNGACALVREYHPGVSKFSMRAAAFLGIKSDFTALVVLTLRSRSTEVYPDDVALDCAAESWSQGVKHQHIYMAAKLRF